MEVSLDKEEKDGEEWELSGDMVIKKEKVIVEYEG